MGGSGFIPNRDGLRELLQSDGIRADLERRANAVADAARANAPVATGEYRDSIEVETGTTDRAVARVVASSGHASLVEAKTRNLGRSLDAARG